MAVADSSAVMSVLPFLLYLPLAVVSQQGLYVLLPSRPPNRLSSTGAIFLGWFAQLEEAAH